MTKGTLEILIEQTASWPKKAREELVESIANIGKKHAGVFRLSEEERIAVRRGLKEMQTRKFASKRQVAALFKRYRA